MYTVRIIAPLLSSSSFPQRQTLLKVYFTKILYCLEISQSCFQHGHINIIDHQ